MIPAGSHFPVRSHLIALLLIFGVILASSPSSAATGQDVQDRIDRDIAAGRPIVVHVVVALCDNVNQGIVPVRAELGDGQNPRTNLYWGALYGVRTHLPRKGGWERLSKTKPDDPRILERIVMVKSLRRGGVSVPVYVVADAWDGAFIRDALQAYLRMTSGGAGESVTVMNESEAASRSASLELAAGGAAHMVAYIGHNGLMDFSLDAPERAASPAPARSAVVLSCRSKSYFLPLLESADAHPLLLTRGLMAPEAYTLDSAIASWIGERTTTAVVEAAAGAYHEYQDCSLNAARGLFWGKE